MNIKPVGNISFANFYSCKPKRKNNFSNSIAFKGNNGEKLSREDFLKQMLALQAQNGVSVGKVDKSQEKSGINDKKDDKKDEIKTQKRKNPDTANSKRTKEEILKTLGTGGEEYEKETRPFRKRRVSAQKEIQIPETPRKPRSKSAKQSSKDSKPRFNAAREAASENNQIPRTKIQKTTERLDESTSLNKIEKLANEAEKSINSGLEDEILKYHNFVKKLLKDHKGENQGDFISADGVKYLCRHDFETIQTEQIYKGKSYNSDWYYEGYPNGKLPKDELEKQTAFIYCSNYDPHSIEYNFRSYNLDDEHGDTDALVIDDKFLYIETAHNWLSPYKIRYLYDKAGNLKQAKIRIYKKTPEAKESILFFDENRKVSKIYYDIKSATKGFCDNYNEACEVYERNNDGGFELVGENVEI